jgi:hypothetical protein
MEFHDWIRDLAERKIVNRSKSISFLLWSACVDGVKSY